MHDLPLVGGPRPPAQAPTQPAGRASCRSSCSQERRCRDEGVLRQDARSCASWTSARSLHRRGRRNPDHVRQRARHGRRRAPFYHFAFNIPENKIVQALEWQKARTPLLAIPERNRAAGFPPEVVDYRHWNAHSVFFLDPAGNVVEYIARHDLKNGDSDAFSWADILYASEIGLVVDDVAATADALKEMAAVAPYKGGERSVHGDGRRIRPAPRHEARPHHRLHGNAGERRARVSHRRQRPRGEGRAAPARAPIPTTSIEERCSCA